MRSSSKSRFWTIVSIIAIGICLPGTLVSCGGAVPPHILTENAHQPEMTLTALLSVTLTATAIPGIPVIGTSTGTPGAMPQFPWRPPKPSAVASLTLGSLGQLAGTGITFQDVDARISGALASAGYDERAYFAVPDGFAIVTRLEMMNEDGYPESSRWSSSLQPISFTEFSMTKYLEALFSAPKGHYRVFVFIVTSDLVVQSGTAVAQATAQTWIVEGANRLPSQMETLPYTREHSTTVYIYEFIQSGVAAEANQNIPSSLTGKQHLERAGLWDLLNAGCPPDPYYVDITYGSVVRAAICPEGERDIFRFSGTSGERVRIQVIYQNGTMRPCLELIAPNNTRTTACELDFKNVIETTLNQTGSYTIVTDVWFAGTTGSYTLVLERIP